MQRLVQRFNWREKLNYYRFYSPGAVKTWFSGVTTSELAERIPFAFNHMDGVPGLLLRILGRNTNLGHRLLSLTNKIIGKTGLPPAGEYWIYRKR